MIAPFPAASTPFLGFGRRLRSFGFAVAPEQVTTFLAAVELLGPRSMADIREAALATLAPPPGRRDEFEAHFRAHFHGEAGAVVEGDEDGETRVHDDGTPRVVAAAALRRQEGGALTSCAELLGVRDFAATSVDLAGFARALPAALPQRRAFRARRTRSGRAIDMRRALRKIVRADGDVPDPPPRRRPRTPRKLLLMIDISGSMKLHTTDYLNVAHAAAQSCDKVEVFTFGTRLTRVTSALRIRDRGRALGQVGGLVADWDGGTRIGPALLALLAIPRFSAFARGAAVVILSDALERGDPSEMATAIRRLGARAYRLSLCTPLAGDARFRPESSGLRAILPYLDDLVDGSSVAALAGFMLTLGRPAPPAAAIWRRK